MTTLLSLQPTAHKHLQTPLSHKILWHTFQLAHTHAVLALQVHFFLVLQDSAPVQQCLYLEELDPAYPLA